MAIASEYLKKLVSPEKAAEAVMPGDWVEYGFGAGFPHLMDKALAARKDELKDVKIRGGLVINPKIETVEADPNREVFKYHSWHIGNYERKLLDRGLCDFVPVILRYLPYYYRNHIHSDVAFVPVSTPDEDGYCGLGITNFAWRTIFENSRVVIFEINEKVPTLQGLEGSHRVHLSEATYIVEGVHDPLPERVYDKASEVEERIAKNVVTEIRDGAVLSLGVGGVPFTVAKIIADSDLKDIGCHTGTLSDAFLDIHKAGKLTNTRKELDAGRSVWNLAAGSQELYDWIREEPSLFRPDCIDYVHNPRLMAQLKNFVSVNSGIEVDLLGQENAETSGRRQLSGTGGQLDYLEGAFLSEGGKGFICIASTHKNKDGTLKSNIVPAIPQGSAVSAPRGLVQYVATEYGVAKLSGLSVRERAEALTNIAHPQFREELSRY
jgi:acyl-CoA hydrolase